MRLLSVNLRGANDRRAERKQQHYLAHLRIMIECKATG